MLMALGINPRCCRKRSASSNPCLQNLEIIWEKHRGKSWQSISYSDSTEASGGLRTLCRRNRFWWLSSNVALAKSIWRRREKRLINNKGTMKVCQRKTVMISDNVESRGQMSAHPLKGETVTVSQSRMGRLSLNPPSGKKEELSKSVLTCSNLTTGSWETA